MRTVPVEGRTGILGVDLSKALGIKTPHYFYRRLGADEVAYVGRASIGLPPGKPMAVIFESGINKAILRSDKPEARPYIEWVTRDVLPSIRKHGAGATGNTWTSRARTPTR